MSELEDAFLSIEALAGLGLHRQPFAPQPPDDFLYSDPVLDMPLNVALGHLRGDHAPVLVRGERGIGKTTLLRRLRKAAGEELHFCSIDGAPDLSMAAIDYCVRLQWQPRPSHGDPRKLAIHDYLLALIRDGVRPVLAVDEAHRLEPEVLGQLLTLQERLTHRLNAPLGLVLAAEPQVESSLATLERTSGVSRLITLALRPLTREQLGGYLQHRLNRAGSRSDAGFSEEEVQRLQRESGGLPDVVNRLATAALERRNSGSSAGRFTAPPLGSRLLLPLIIVLVAAGIGIALYGLLSGGGDPHEETGAGIAVAPTPAPTEPEPAPSPPAQPPPEPTVPAPRVEGPQPEAEPAAGGAALDSPGAQATPTALDESSDSPAPPPAADAPPRTSEQHTEPVSAAVSAPEPATPPPAPAPEAVVEPESQAPAPPPQRPARQPDGLRDATWLATQPANHYTIQLLGVSNREALQRFAARHSLPEPAVMLESERSGEAWWILVAGVYPDAESARAAIRALPPELRATAPWIRRVGDLR
jgi:DamX protein